jgi:hypothetical protein
VSGPTSADLVLLFILHTALDYKPSGGTAYTITRGVLPRKASRMAKQVFNCNHFGVLDPVHDKVISNQLYDWRVPAQFPQLWMIVYQDTHSNSSHGFGAGCRIKDGVCINRCTVLNRSLAE